MTATSQNIKLIDTHCHLGHKSLNEHIGSLLAQAACDGVYKIICASGHIEESEFSVALAKKHKNVYALVGIHPHEAREVQQADYDKIKTLAANDGVVAIGEIGLDYHYDFSPRDVQQKVFAAQLSAAEETNLPVVIHTREALADTLSVLKNSSIDPQRVVFHSCSEGPENVKQMLDYGASISFSGIATFKTAPEVRKGVSLVPLDRMMVETDSPYLSPEPVRKIRPNIPANVKHVATYLAAHLNMTLAELAERTTANAERFFGI